MSLVKAIYIFLHVSAVIIMYVSGSHMATSKTSKSYWRSAIPAILAYGVCFGLRFGRGIDYNGYARDYIGTIDNINYGEEGLEFFYRLITWVLGNIGVPFWFFVFLCSIFFVISIIAILEDYKECSGWALFLFPFLSIQSENLLRWYFALSFVLCAYKLFTKKKYIAAIIFAAISVFIHTGMVLILFFLISIYYIPKTLPVSISLLLVFLSFYLGNKDSFLISLAPFVAILSLNDKSTHYAEDFERIFIDNESNYIGLSGSMLLTIVQLLVYSYVIIVSHRLYNRGFITSRQYNYTYIAIILFPLFSSFNVLARFPDSMMLFYCITFSMCIVNTKKLFKKDLMLKYMRIMAIAFTVYGTIMTWSVNLPDAHYLYIWDSNGMPYSDKDLSVDKR